MPLKPSMGIKAYIKDFQKSDAPQFKGKSKEERRTQAVAAYLDAKDKLKEEKGRGPTGIAYSLPKGHPDAENPATRKKYPERQTPEYKKKFFDKSKSSPSSHGMKEAMDSEINVDGYQTKHFHMCGSAIKTMKKHADKEGAKSLTKMQDVFYKMEKDVMNAGEATDAQKKQANMLYTKIMAKARSMGIEDEVGDYMKMHLDSVIKGDPKPGFGRVDMKESLNETKVIVGKHLDKAGIPYSYAGGPEPMVRQKDAAKAKALINKLHKDGTIKRNPGVTAYDKGPNIRPISTALKKKLGIKENAFRPPHLSKLDVDHHKARDLMSSAKHREEGIKNIMKGMKVSKAKATKMHDNVMKAYGFRPESVNEISVGLRNRYYDAAKRSHDTAANSAFAASLRKEPYDKEMDTMRKRKKGIKTAKDQAIKNIRGELYKKKANEAVEYPHAMYDPKTGKKVMAKTPADHNKYDKMGYTHDKPKINEDGHTDVASAKTNVKVAASALQKMSAKLSKLSDGDSLPSWWTNKVAVAVDNLDGMADYIDTKVESVTRRGKPIFQPQPGDSPERTAMIKSTQDSLQRRKERLAKAKKDRAAAYKAGKPFDMTKALGYGKSVKEMTMGQGIMVKKVPAGSPAPKGFELKKLARVHGGKFDVYHKETEKVKDAKAGRTMYSDTTTEKLDHQDKPLVKKVVGMLKKASKAHAGQAKSLSKAMTDEAYIKSDKVFPNPQANLSKRQKDALGKAKATKTTSTDFLNPNFASIAMAKKAQKAKDKKVGRGSEIVKYGRRSSNESKVNEVSMKTLGNYIKKRQHDVAAAGSQMTGDYGIGPAEKKAKRRAGVDAYVKATRNISRAVDKMTGQAKVPATKEGMNSYMASTRSMQGVVHARDEDHAREIMRTKHGAKGKIDLRLKGPVSKTTRERRPLGPMDRQESTWYMPTGKEVTILRNMMKRPIALGENAENAIDNIPIGSDTLHKIFVAEAKKDPNTDARTMIESWLSDRLKRGDEEAEWLGIKLGLLEGYEADVSKFMNKHDIDHHWSGGKLHVDKKDEKRAMKKLSKKYGGYGPRGAKMMPQVHVKK